MTPALPLPILLAAALLAVWLALLPPEREGTLLQIKTTGVEDFIDGSANIKALVIGGPGAGKTRMSSYWPKPIYLDCENGRGSLADRAMPYAEIKGSKDMLDALEYLKGLERTPKAQRQFQTVVVDTADSFQRLVKDEWVQQTKAGSFTGFDAWGYLDTKMQLLFTRLLNLDYNVIVLVHYTSKEHKDGDNTVREFTLQLQGNVKDTIYNDFGLVGWLGTFWAAGEEGRVQKRGLTFQPTPDKPFLKDRFNVTPKWMEINFSDNDYQQLFTAFFDRPEIDAMAESTVVGEIPDSDKVRPPAGTVNPPAEGGPLPPRAPSEVPLEKKLKGELEEIAKGLGLQVRGNMLKDELVGAIRKAQAPDAPAAPAADAPLPPVPPRSGSRGGGFDAASAMASISKGTEVAGPDPTSPASSPAASPEVPADAAAASNETSTSTATSSAPTEVPAPPVDEAADLARAEALVAQPIEAEGGLGAQVISRETTDAPETTPPVAPAKPAPKGPSACADCGGDLAAEWADPAQRDYIRLGFVKHRRYLCSTCRAAATK